MRRGLYWTLAATVLLSVAALWGADNPRLVSAVESSMREHQESLDPGSIAYSRASAPTTTLPEQIPRLIVDLAKRDVFVPHEMPAASQPGPPTLSPSAPLPVVIALTPPPQAPPLNARFLGRMTTPEGKRLVYLARGDLPLAVSVGQRLDDGYLVESITAEGVTLNYPPLDVRVVVPIPPAAPQ